MILKPPKASIAKNKSKGAGTAFKVSYRFFYPPLENGAQTPSYGTILANGYFDASAPCSWTLTITCGNTHGGENSS